MDIQVVKTELERCRGEGRGLKSVPVALKKNVVALLHLHTWEQVTEGLSLSTGTLSRWRKMVEQPATGVKKERPQTSDASALFVEVPNWTQPRISFNIEITGTSGMVVKIGAVSQMEAVKLVRELMTPT